MNYDLPWNPNRLEQRFGRIHRIGQREVCHLWNLVASETREGDVFFRSLKNSGWGRGDRRPCLRHPWRSFSRALAWKDLTLEAIRYGDQPEVRARLRQRLENAFDHDKLRDILSRNALAQESMSAERLFAVKQRTGRFPPAQQLFMKAELPGGSIHPREATRFEVTHVPASIRERDRIITGQLPTCPVLAVGERVCRPAKLSAHSTSQAQPSPQCALSTLVTRSCSQ